MRNAGFFWFLVFLLVPALAVAGQKLVFSGFEAPGITPPVVRELQAAYGELGIEIEVKITEPSRGLVSSSSGVTDGEVIRIAEIGDRYPALVRVDVPLISIATCGYTNRPELRDRPLEDLRPLRAGYVRGAVFAENAAKAFAETWSADNTEQLFGMLKQNRLDVVFVARTRGDDMIAKLGLADVYPIPASYREYPFYHYLNERHRDLVPRIEEVLRERYLEEKETPAIR